MITLTKQSKEIVSRLIRKEFDQNVQFWLYDRSKELIETAREFQLDELADEMESDMSVTSKSFLS